MAEVNTTQDDAILQQIETAWKNRAASIRSLALKVDMEEFKKGRGDKPIEDAGPFSDSLPETGRLFNIELEYFFAHGKGAVTRSGPIIDPSDPEKTSQQITRNTFDGHENRSYGEQTNFLPMGSIKKQKVAEGTITQRADLLAVNLWLQPKVVVRAVWGPTNASVERESIDVNGIKCRRIRMSRSTPRWTSAIDVDSEQGWVPTQWQMWLDKKLTMKLTTKYRPDAKAGPVVMEWVCTHYSKDGGFETIRKAKVLQIEVNTDIDDKRFTINFPVGTQVLEEIGKNERRYYIQEASGLVPIKKSEFGRPKAERSSGAMQNDKPRLRAQLVAFADDRKFAGQKSSEALHKAGFSPLIEKDSLTAWDIKPWHEGHWTIKDNVINYDGKAKGKRKQQDNSLWTKKSYGDFTIYAEWRLPAKPTMHPTPIVLFNGDFLMDENNKRVTRPQLDAGDSGLMFRGTSKCQANIWCQDLGSGEINGYRTDRKMPPSVRRACIPIKKADRPMGEWNAFLVTMKGDRMTVELNGEHVIDAAELPGVPKSGPIGLQHHGDPVQFRQIWVKTLN